ncbi:MAG TPA: branched-chain amino acid ABC transporter substrate-binding protein [Candidatus Acidoferrales bacterium]|nr:branched-chain amino acid ABC transporter substrate-binding protein [Candidatus Acidoferrales bacterium]
MITRRRFLGGAAATATALQASAARADISGIPSTTVTIGVAGPLTGEDHQLGEQLANGVRQAVAEANQIHGTFDVLFDTRTFDDQNLLAQATVTSQLVIDDGTVDALVGHLSGRVTEGALRNYVEAHLAVIVPTSGYDRLTEYGYGGVLRLLTKDSTEGNLGAKYCEDWFKPKSVAVLYQDGDYGFDVANGFSMRLGADKITYTPIKISWEKPDFVAAAQQTMAAKPDLVYLAGTVGDMGPVLDELADVKYDGALAASQGFFAQATLDKYATSAEGLVASSSIPPFQFAPADTQLIEDYQQAYGPLTSIAAFGYAGAQIVIDAVRRTGLVERAAIWQTLQQFGSYDTIIGTLSFLTTGDQMNPNVYFYEVKNGKWVYQRAAHAAGFLVK